MRLMGVGKKDDELNHQRKKNKKTKKCLKKRDQCIKLKWQTFNCKASEQRKLCVLFMTLSSCPKAKQNNIWLWLYVERLGEYGCWERWRDVKIRRKHHKSFRSLWVHLKLSKSLQKETTFYQTDLRDIRLKQGHITTVNTLRVVYVQKITLLKRLDPTVKLEFDITDIWIICENIIGTS